MRESRFFLILLILLTTFPAYAASQVKLQINSIRYSGTGVKSRIVLDLNQKTDFRAFMLDNPCRVVLDLHKAKWKISKSRLLSDSIVKSYRSGELGDGLTRAMFEERIHREMLSAAPSAQAHFGHLWLGSGPCENAPGQWDTNW